MTSTTRTKILAINLGLFCAVIFAAELIFGNWVFGPQFGFLNIPRNTNYHFKVDDLYENAGKTINYRRDDLGFRGGDKNSKTDLSKIDILTIGGSTTNQLYIDEHETWQSHLTSNFAKAGVNVTILNAGVDGQSTRGHVAIFDRWLSKIKNLKTRYILAYVGVNDMHIENARLGDEMNSDDLGRRLRHLIINNSALYNLFRTIRGNLRARSSKLVHGAKPPKVKKWVKVQKFNTKVQTPVAYVDRLAAYKIRLLKLVKKIRAFGAEPIIVTQHVNVYRIQDNSVYFPANAPQVSQQWAYPIVRSFNNVSMGVCKSQKAICLDLAKDIVFQEDDFYDYVHNTPKGTRKIGRYLYQQLESKFR